MTPEAAFAAGARASLKNAYVSNDAHGQFICGEIHDDSQKRYLDGEMFRTSYLTKQIDKDVWLTRTGVTYFVLSWRPVYED